MRRYACSRAALALVLVWAGCRGGEVKSPQPPPEIQVPWASADAGSDPVITQDVPPEIPVEAAPQDDMVRTAAPLEGPEKKLADLCGKCTVTKKLPAAGPYKAVQIVKSTWSSPASKKMKNTSFGLAIRTQEGWYLMSHLGTSGMLCGGDSLFSVDFTLDGFEMKDVFPGDPPEILLTWEGSAHGISDNQILICSIGPSGTPSCIGPLISVRNHPSAAKSWDSGITFTPEGQLTFTSGTEVTGPYTLVFP